MTDTGSVGSRILGAVLVAVAGASLVFTVVAAIQVWQIRDHLAGEVEQFLDQVSLTLETTEQALDVADETLDSTARNLDTLGTTLVLVADTIDGSRDAVGEIGQMLRSAVPDSVRATQRALQSARRAAGLVDDTLERLSELPIIGGAALEYSPDTALGDAVGDVEQSMNSVPDALEDVGGRMVTTGDDLGDVAANLSLLGSDVQQINTSVDGAKDVVAQYRLQVNEYQHLVDDARDSAPDLLRKLAIGLSFALSWLAVLQAWVLVKGWGLMTAKDEGGTATAA
ncbi:MAG: hypothetical protein ACK2UL_02935 [Anaerolineae bacterium]